MSQELMDPNHPANMPAVPQQSAAAMALSQTPSFMPGMNVGAVAVEQQRAIADTKAKRLIAREYRRSTLQATQEVREVCRIPEFANIAFYSVPRGGGTVTGDSIRMAEELARCWGNIEYGHRELSRDDKKSEVMVFATDLETGVECSRQLTVMHVIDTKQGPKKCRDQKEIDDLINNKASKQRRGCILAVIPQWLREIAREECKKTLAGDNTVPIAVRVRKMVDTFASYGVTVDLLEAKLGHALDKATAEDLVNLTGVYNALREGDAVGDHFEMAEKKVTTNATGAAITNAAKQAAAATDAGGEKKPAENATQAQKTRTTSKPADSKPAQTDSKAAKEPPAESVQKTAAQESQPPAADDEPPPPSSDDVF